MELWFTENQTSDLRLSFRVKQLLYHRKSAYQEILVVDTYEYGRLLALDGAIQLTEKDEFTYHEMITHVPLYAHPLPESVLIIGGGDGGAVREVVKHREVKSVEMVEIDEEVINVSKRYFPSVSSGLKDKRVSIKIEDGMAYVKGKKKRYDVIIVDSTDPVEIAKVLFEKPFYRNVFYALKDDGIFVAQTESPFCKLDVLKSAYNGIKAVFDRVWVYWGVMPTYPSGMWTYTIGSKRYDVSSPIRECDVSTRYYTPEVHRSAFVLPPFLKEWISTV